jgi:TatD DNase family protein
MLVDSHCHLDFPDFAPEVDAVVARANAAGVGYMVTVATRVREHAALVAIAERYPCVVASVGTHPHYAAEEADVTVETLLERTTHPKVVAIGEAGLDYFYDTCSHDAQQQCFRIHVDAARKSGLPLIIHTRDADADTARILEEEAAKGSFIAVLHCFSSGRDLAQRALALGHYISFSGVLTFKRSEELRALAAELPADRILVETDSPYLAPGKFRGKRNEPSYVVETAKVLAAARGVPFDTLAAQTTENFFRLFGKAPRPAAAVA